MIFDFSYFVKYYPEFHFLSYLTGFQFILLDTSLLYPMSQAHSDPNRLPCLANAALFEAPVARAVW